MFWLRGGRVKAKTKTSVNSTGIDPWQNSTRESLREWHKIFTKDHQRQSHKVKQSASQSLSSMSMTQQSHANIIHNIHT